MKLTILRGNFKVGLDIVGRIAGDASSTLTILKNFLIEVVDNRIKMSATNLELAIMYFVSGKVIEGGGITIPASTVNSIISNIQSERIALETDGDNLIVKTDNYEAKIQGIKIEEFPIIPKLSGNEINLQIDNGVFQEALLFVVNAAPVGDSRPELNGILFDFETSALKIAATDSFRLAEKTIGGDYFIAETSKRFRAIIPLKTIFEVIRIFKNINGKINIYFDHNQVLFGADDSEIISRLISGDFPDYEPIIPKQIETEIALNRDELINALKLASSFTDKLNEVKIVLKDKSKNIEIYSSRQGLGENRYLIPVKSKGPAVEAVFNWKFLLDGLKGIASEDAIFGLNGSDKPAIIRGAGDSFGFYIVMPIKAG